jgi:hypothetical protein
MSLNLEYRIQTRIKRITRSLAKIFEEISGVQVTVESEDKTSHIRLVLGKVNRDEEPQSIAFQ